MFRRRSNIAISVVARARIYTHVAGDVRFAVAINQVVRCLITRKRRQKLDREGVSRGNPLECISLFNIARLKARRCNEGS